MERLVILTACAIALTGCDVEQTEPGEMPDVDVSVEPGDMPEYDVDWVNVDVGTTTRTTQVPRVVVTMEEEEVEVPYIDVSMPDDHDFGEQTERTLLVEAEITGEMHELTIEEVYATGNRLIVISELESTGETLGDERVRISDRLVLNAPADLDVRHYIIGDPPEGDFNTQHTFITDRSEIQNLLQNGRAIYGG